MLWLRSPALRPNPLSRAASPKDRHCDCEPLRPERRPASRVLWEGLNPKTLSINR